MKFVLLLIGLTFVTQVFSQTDIDFFETITLKTIDEVDAQLSELGYNLIRSDSAKKFYSWRNSDEDGFTYQKGWFKVSMQKKGKGLASVTLQHQLRFKYITSDKEKYYSIQTSLSNSKTYIKGNPVQTKSGIMTEYKYDEIEVTTEKVLISKEDGSIYTVTYIINQPK